MLFYKNRWTILTGRGEGSSDRRGRSEVPQRIVFISFYFFGRAV